MRAIKQPTEKVTFVYDFSADLGVSTIQSISGVPVAVARDGGANITIDGVAAFDTSTVTVRWQGGVAGESYATTVRVVDTSGNIFERDGQIDVIETTFVLPTGIASRYLTAEEYVERFGTAETVRLTDENRTNTVDAAKLEAAIGDATDMADGYIGTLYTTPLLGVPRVVKSIVAALARELLHKTKPTPEVKERADQSRQQLRDIASGRMTLPVEQGEAEPVIGGNRLAVTSGDADSTFSDAMSGYGLSDPTYIPNWRR